jgi:hypothetical protein
LLDDKSRTLDFDGIATLVFPTLEAAEAFNRDPESQKTVNNDGKIFTHMSSLRLLVGEEVVFYNQVASK